uniref:SHOCT domain-containing protein n=1 Tax=Desulfatirhabdium butyrativorans TaxID=340467 RepID=A0A7C4RTI2_9BACT
MKSTASASLPNMQSETHLKSVLMAYGILVLHLILIAGLGLLVLFFRGFIEYMIWVFLGGSTALAVSAYRFYKRMKQEGKTLKEMLSMPMFRNRAVEISLLGGMASLKLGKPEPFRASQVIESTVIDTRHQLEDPVTNRIKELSELARLLENDLITLDEFNQIKGELFRFR